MGIMQQKGNGLKGFTLIEIMVVIIMIGILASIAFPMYLNHAKKAKMTDVIMTVKAIANYLSEQQMSGKNIANLDADDVMEKLGLKDRFFNISLENNGNKIVATAKEEFSSSERGYEFSYTYSSSNPDDIKFEDERGNLLEQYADYIPQD
ncbi:MAG: prepilin-type N-terminal cleavage/methylation domain-containing protein [bacterium]